MGGYRCPIAGNGNAVQIRQLTELEKYTLRMRAASE